MGLGDEKYVLLTTFRRDGTPVATPVWAAPLESGEIGIWTSSGSGKVKRIAHTSRVTVQPCDARGRPKPATAPVDATARLVEGDDMAEIKRTIHDKYGMMTKVTKLLGTLGGIVKRNHTPSGDQGVIVAVEE